MTDALDDQPGNSGNGDACFGTAPQVKPASSTPFQPAFETDVCCGTPQPADETDAACCSKPNTRIDWLLWGSGIIVATGYLIHVLAPTTSLTDSVAHFSHGVYTLMNTMWWGIALGIVFVGLIGRVPRDLVMSALGRDGGLNGILRATGAGLLLDLCSHGILMVGMRLYERGASLGQVMAFLIASPWNSISLTIILVALIGLPWTLAFIVLSAIVAIASGLIFERLTANGTLPSNPNRTAMNGEFQFWPEVKRTWNGIEWRSGLVKEVLVDGLKESTMILRWLLFGVVLASLFRSFLSVEDFRSRPTYSPAGAHRAMRLHFSWPGWRRIIRKS